MSRWFAVQRYCNDDWGVGSSSFTQAAKMLYEQGFGLIAVIEDDLCVDEFCYDDCLVFLRENLGYNI